MTKANAFVIKDRVQELTYIDRMESLRDYNLVNVYGFKKEGKVIVPTAIALNMIVPVNENQDGFKDASTIVMGYPEFKRLVDIYRQASVKSAPLEYIITQAESQIYS